MKKKQICARCVCDDSIPGITFDNRGVCSLCKNYDLIELEFPSNENTYKKFQQIVDNIKNNQSKGKYDCLIGISGGTDSIYTLYLARKYGLNPLALHIDDGSDTEISVHNVQTAVKKLNVDLYTVKIDESEISDLELAFFRASIPDVETPPDMAITASLYHCAVKFGIKYIFVGNCFKTEGKMPPGWSYGDGKYLTDIHNRFGRVSLKKFPNLMLSDYLYYFLIKRIQIVRPLYYLPYIKSDVKKILEKELGWIDYGIGHHESRYCRFVQGYFLPKKFGIDKRKIHFSALVRSNQMSRQEALNKLELPACSDEMVKEDIQFLCNNFGIEQNEFNEIINSNPRSQTEFDSYYSLVCKLKPFIEIAYKLHLFPTKIYGSYNRK
ncbi:N-acetyl sugar amidotransferase [Methanoregula formicica]|uniref:N-acetyl sugar amidotransferase n=1 Tax=Methanoregula formicica (strain DSM 22288 / NBRC 105244 / SMSP) TaxID=593750 RepID=L0HF65_METFS|nr:N-acetyl sugar amidotransferase [Methanoregula formicica]AGB02441.1 N-acetyl sugar amidotransferase [Methanoregula formicica SMSP]